MKKIYYVVSMLLLSKAAFSQEKIGTNPTVINSNAVLELEATNKGLLLPRVALTSLISPTPLSSNVAGMTIYNTATAGTAPNNVTPGVYFNDGTKWIRVGDESLTGKTILNGTSNPTTQGNIGDFYINTTANTIFGPKTLGGWGTGTSLIGSQGVAGVNGNTLLNGPSDPLAAIGVNGDFYLNTTSKTLFGPKASGVWPSTATSLFGPQGVAGPTGPQGPAGNIASLTNGRLLIGNASNLPTEQTMSGDVTITNTGVATISSNAIGSTEIIDASIVTTDIANDAVTMAKIDQGSATSGQVLTWNGTDWAPQTNLGASGNIYNADGIISSNTRNVNLATNDCTLKFNTLADNGHINFGENPDTWRTINGSAQFEFGSTSASNTIVTNRFNSPQFSPITISSSDYGTPNSGIMGVNFPATNASAATPYLAFGVNGIVEGYGFARRIGGTLGTVSNETYTNFIWGSLGYRNSGGTEYGLYGVSTMSGSGLLPSTTIDGIGGGFFGGIAGSVSKGDVIGAVNSGELFASYNSGNTYTLGKNVEIVKTSNEQKTAVYSITCTESTIYTKGKGTLNGGSVYISFDQIYTSLLEEEPVVTITPNGECNGLYIESVDKNGFTIRELGNGTSNVAISWIAVGNRIDNSVDRATQIVTKPDFETNIQEVLYDDNKSGQAQEMWWNGTEIQFGQQPIKQTKKASTNK